MTQVRARVFKVEGSSSQSEPAMFGLPFPSFFIHFVTTVGNEVRLIDRW